MKHIYVTPRTEVPAHKRDGSKEFPFKTLEEACLGGVPDPRGPRVQAILQRICEAWEPIPLTAKLADLGFDQVRGCPKLTLDGFIGRAFGLDSAVSHMLTEPCETGVDILDRLERILGPSLPDKDGYLELTEGQFINRYRPEETEWGDVYIQREWAGDDEIIRAAIARNCCWTAVEGDDGDFCVEWGNRWVNRLFNILTLKPIEDKSWHVVAFDPDDREEEEE